LAKDELKDLLDKVIPPFLKSDTGLWVLKPCVLRLCRVNKDVIYQLSGLFEKFLDYPNMSYFHIKRYAEFVSTILNVKDGATEDRMMNYLDFHMGHVVELVKMGRCSMTLRVPLETLALIVNNGGKEMKQLYKRVAYDTFPQELKDAGKFRDNF